MTLNSSTEWDTRAGNYDELAKLVGEWQAVRVNREEDSFERLRKGLECFDEQTAELLSPSH
jgi:hypothetical protein